MPTKPCQPLCLLLLGALIAITAPTLAFAGGGSGCVVGGPRASSNQSYVFVANEGGDRKSLRVQVRDGQMVLETNPDPDRAWLGILYAPAGDRVRVTGVAGDSPAAAAGLKVGDVIETVDGKAVSAEAVLGRPLRELHPGDRITLRGTREGKAFEATATLAAHPGTMRVELPADQAHWASGDILGGLGEMAHFKSLEALEGLKALKGMRIPCLPGCEPGCTAHAFAFGGASRPRLGVMVENMSDQLARYFGAEPGQGILVMDVVAGSPAEKAGIAAGDVIVSVDGVGIEATSDVGEALRDAEPGTQVKVDVLRRGARESFMVEVERKTSKLEWNGDTTDAIRAVHEALQRVQGSHGDAGTVQVEIERALREVEEAQEELESLDDAAGDAGERPAPSPKAGARKLRSTSPAPAAPAGRRGRML